MAIRFLLLLGLALGAQAAEVAGVRFEDRTAVGGWPVALSGAGVRQRFLFDVYAVALYVADPKADRVAQGGAKRVAIRMLRDVDAGTFSKALADGMRANHDAVALRALEPRIAALAGIMARVKEAKKGMAIDLDWDPAGGTRVLIDGSLAGTPIAGEDFYQGLLRIWLGAAPVQEDLKKALLGG